MNNQAEQSQEIIDFVTGNNGNLVIEALAGTGKTYTLLKIIEEINQREPEATIALCCFNKSIEKEISGKIAAKGFRNVVSRTFHSHGLAAIRKAWKFVKVDMKKIRNIMDNLDIPWCYRSFLEEIIKFAKIHGVGCSEDKAINSKKFWIDIIEKYNLDERLEGKDDTGVQANIEDGLKFAVRVLITANKDTKTVDFPDMLYFINYYGMKMDQYDYVLVDEGQDTSPDKMILIEKMMKP